MRNRWNDDPLEKGAIALEALVRQAHLIGAEESLVLWGGGNNSVKTVETDFRGRQVRVLRVKGSGSDMKSMAVNDYPGVRLDDVEPLAERESMDDAAMVAYLAHTLLEPGAPRPSIETLLHDFLPFASVVHTHADAILALADTERGEGAVRSCFGDSVIITPYLRPGFANSKQVYDAVKAQPTANGLIMMNHGLITWGNSVEEAYNKHIALITQAEEFIAVARKNIPFSQLDSSDEHREAEKHSLAARVAPILRGALSPHKRVVLHFDDSADVLAFLARPDAHAITQHGPATPDHALHTKLLPLWLDTQSIAQAETSPDFREHIVQAVQSYVAAYSAFYELYKTDEPMLEPYPRVILMPGVGMWTTGKDARAARIVADIYHHTIGIITAAEAIGHYKALPERDLFDVEYWPLELYKLTLLPPDKELARRVVIITGAASGIGRDIARRFAAESAHVVVTDIDAAGAAAVAGEIVQKYGLGRAIAFRLDVTSEEQVKEAYTLTLGSYGGLDILVSNAGVAHVAAIDALSLKDWQASLAVNATGHFLMAREAMRIFKQQGIGGNIVFNATKNVTAPGKDFGAYSAAKAAEAQLCRILAIEGGEFGVRANMLNPDAIFEGSRLWSEELKSQRAASYGVSSDTLEGFYNARNLLKTRITGADVAEAALFLASDRSAKTTGAMLPVDGGVKEAFPR